MMWFLLPELSEDVQSYFDLLSSGCGAGIASENG
jgi:hypothetical protein